MGLTGGTTTRDTDPFMMFCGIPTGSLCGEVARVVMKTSEFARLDWSIPRSQKFCGLMIRIKIRDPKLVKLFGQTLANRFIKTIYHEDLIGCDLLPENVASMR